MGEAVAGGAGGVTRGVDGSVVVVQTMFGV